MKDDFVRAVAICKNTAVNCDVIQMAKDILGVSEQPKCPEMLKHFIEANEQSSSDLRKEAGAAGLGMSKNVSYPAL